MTIIDIQAILPLIIIAGGATLLLTVISFVRNYAVSFFITAITLVAAFATLIGCWNLSPHPITNLFVVDGFGIIYMGISILATLAVAHFAFDYFKRFDDNREEFFVLLLIAGLGGVVLSISTHFISFFLGLELMSVSLYSMVAYTIKRDIALEAGIKYLLLAAASAAILLFGMALIYAELGTMSFSLIGSRLDQLGDSFNPILIYAGVAMIFAGVGFKLSLVPFHWWTPDIYQGAPAPVSAFLATVSKAGAVAVSLRLFSSMDIADSTSAASGILAVVILSILVGNLLALSQRNLKRLLAYSSIAHLGYLAIAFVVGGNRGIEAATLYMIAYLVTSLGTFGVVSALSTSERECETLDDIRGLYYKRPGLAMMMTFMMLSLAGIPLTAGFIGKFFVMVVGAAQLDQLYQALLALVIGSAIGLFYYLKVIWAMFQKDVESEAPLSGRLSEFAFFALVVASVILLFLGIYPTPLVELVQGVVADL